MSWIKEFGWLAKQLFTGGNKDYNQLKFKKMEHFPFNGYSAMMWCGYLISRYDENKLNAQIWTHERIHQKFAEQKGSWFKFYMNYLWEWIKGNPLIKPAKSAYYTIPTEMEAYANQHNERYPHNYDPENIKKYCIKDRKKTFKKYYNQGGVKCWKQFLRTL